MNWRSLAVPFLTCSAVVAIAVPAVAQPQWLTVGDQQSQQDMQVWLDSASDMAATVGCSMSGVLASPVQAPDGTTYTQLSIPGCGATAQQVGFPELPFKGFFLEIPYSAEVSVEVLGAASVSLGTGFKLYPLQPPLPDRPTGEEQAFQIDAAAYAADHFFPPDPVVLAEPGFIRGRRVVFVEVFPIQYNPATTEVRAFSWLRFAVHFSATADPAEAARKQRLATAQSEALAEILILNYLPAPAGSEPNGPRLFNGADYLIIVADVLYEEVLPLAQWKHKKGFITRVTKLSQIGSTSAAVKSYIQTAYNTWNPAPSYVLLVGDSQDVPAGYYSGSYGCTSDHGYACVDGSDYYPDLALGRLSVHTETACTNVVNKTLTYDRSPDPGNWYNHFLAAAYFQDDGDGGSQGRNDGVADRWFMETAMTVYHFVVDSMAWNGHTALCTTYWPLTYPPDQYHFRPTSYPHRPEINLARWGVSPYPDPVPTWIVNLWTSASQATANISAAINGGTGLVLHRDHGGETEWGDPPYNNGNINSLSNGVKTPVVFSMNCLTGSFQYSAGDCFCEAFLKKYPGGAVGIVGATRTSFSGYNDLITHGLCNCFWPGYDPTYPNTIYPYSWRPIEALSYGKYYMLTYEGADAITAGEFYMFHWFGDPELMLRSATPRPLMVSHPAAVMWNVPVDIKVTVTQAGAPLANALVCISHSSVDDYWTGLTNASGVVTFSGVVLTQQSDYNIVVSERNSVPYEGIISAVLSSLPGDLNCDGEANLGDVNPFVLALSDLSAYELLFPDCPFGNRDINGDGSFDFRDINPFVALLVGQ
jgi:hypothetical protein